MAECKGVEYTLTLDEPFGPAYQYNSDWFNSDRPAARAAAIQKLIRELFPGDPKKGEPRKRPARVAAAAKSEFGFRITWT